MLSALAEADSVTWISIGVKALVYATTLWATGSVLCVLTLRRLPQAEVQNLKQIAALCAVIAAALSVARISLRASFLMGGTWQGATDAMMLSMVGESPLGTSVALRLVGLGLILAILFPHRTSRWLAVLGAVIVAASFAFRGHALEDPRLLLGVLITLHILGLAFWLGAFAPLYRLSGGPLGNSAGQVTHHFFLGVRPSGWLACWRWSVLSRCWC